ncbi:hypothetical protein E4T39_03636 [Aureobasidium subglaciale]|nr:hypothetical protein E4T39_03636 [Aureobasidium subglaciale]
MSPSPPSSPGPAPYPPNALRMHDTIFPKDLPRFEAFLDKERGDNTFDSYDVNSDGKVELRIHDADTNEVIDREVFEDNGNAERFLQQENEVFEENKRSGWWVAPEGWEVEMEEKDRKLREKEERRKNEEEKQ